MINSRRCVALAWLLTLDSSTGSLLDGRVPVRPLHDAAKASGQPALRGAAWDLNQALLRHRKHKSRVRERENAPDPADVHIVFSTGCNEFQHWQSELLANTALRVGQQGKMTHIIVGCETREDAGMQGKARLLTHVAGEGDNVVSGNVWRQSSNPNVKLHFAPAVPEAKEFPWFNKPWSFYHWMKTAQPKESVIVIIDPDEFFLQPLTQGRRPRRDILSAWPAEMESKVTDVVRPGWAVAQTYGLGVGWLSKFDRVKMCGADSYCAKLDAKEAGLYYTVGPPYLIHQKDFGRIIDLWWKYMKPTYAQDKGDILADMFAYNMAAAKLDVRHVVLDHFMVSAPLVNSGEGWKFVDALQSLSCHNPAFPEGAPVPNFIHAAQHYHACSKGDTPAGPNFRCPGGDSELFDFHKGHVPSRVLECDQPLLALPPDDLFNVQTKASDRRNAFMVCFLHRMVNDAVMDYKRRWCKPGYNLDKCVRIALSGDGEYPLARRVCGTPIRH
jgi:hypothetical protein